MRLVRRPAHILLAHGLTFTMDDIAAAANASALFALERGRDESFRKDLPLTPGDAADFLLDAGAR